MKKDDRIKQKIMLIKLYTRKSIFNTVFSSEHRLDYTDTHNNQTPSENIFHINNLTHATEQNRNQQQHKLITIET